MSGSWEAPEPTGTDTNERGSGNNNNMLLVVKTGAL